MQVPTVDPRIQPGALQPLVEEPESEPSDDDVDGIEPGSSTALVPTTSEPEDQIEKARIQFEEQIQHAETLAALKDIEEKIKSAVDEFSTSFDKNEQERVESFKNALQTILTAKKGDVAARQIELFKGQFNSSQKFPTSNLGEIAASLQYAADLLRQEANTPMQATGNSSIQAHVIVGGVTVVNNNFCSQGAHAPSQKSQLHLPSLPSLSLPKLPSLATAISSVFKKAVPISPFLFYHAVRAYASGGVSIGAIALQTAALLVAPTIAKKCASLIVPRPAQRFVVPTVELGTQALIITQGYDLFKFVASSAPLPISETAHHAVSSHMDQTFAPFRMTAALATMLLTFKANKAKTI